MEQPKLAFPTPTDLLGKPLPIKSLTADERARFVAHHLHLCNAAIHRAEMRELIATRRAAYARRQGQGTAHQIIAIHGDTLILADLGREIEAHLDELEEVYQTASEAKRSCQECISHIS